MHPGQPSMMPVFSFLLKSFSLFYCLCCIVKMLHLLHLIDGLCNSCRRSRINDYIIDISVQHVLYCQRAVFICLASCVPVPGTPDHRFPLHSCFLSCPAALRSARKNQVRQELLQSSQHPSYRQMLYHRLER